MRKFIRKHIWIVVAVAIFVPPCVAGVTEYILTGGVSGWIPLVSGLVGGVPALGFWWFVELSSATQPSDFVVQPNESKVFSPRTPAELIASVRGLTEIAANHAMKPHIGYWLKVDGSIFDVFEASFGNELTVHIEESRSKASVFLDFDGKVWGARVRLFAIKDRISANGKIESISTPGSITLKECELVNKHTPTSF